MLVIEPRNFCKRKKIFAAQTEINRRRGGGGTLGVEICHVAEAIVIGGRVEHVDNREVVNFFQALKFAAERQKNFAAVIFPHDFGEREENSHGICAVLHTKLDVIFQNAQIIFYGRFVKSFRQPRKFVLPIRKVGSG